MRFSIALLVFSTVLCSSAISVPPPDKLKLPQPPAKNRAIKLELLGTLQISAVREQEELTVEARAPRTMLVTKYYLNMGPAGRMRLDISNGVLEKSAKKLDGKPVRVIGEFIGMRLLNTGRAMPGQDQAFLRVKSLAAFKVK